MRQYLIIIGFVFIAACNQSKKNNNEGDQKDSNTVVPLQTDSNTVMPTAPDTTGKIDIETFGPLKLEQSFNALKEVLGSPDSKSKAVEWAADGLNHEDWTWKTKGLVLNMSYDKKNKDATLSIFSITATAPCDFKTKAGIGIGSSYADVAATYKKDIDPEATDKTQITVGSVYGGIIFSFTNNKVSNIFLGAAAE